MNSTASVFVIAALCAALPMGASAQDTEISASPEQGGFDPNAGLIGQFNAQLGYNSAHGAVAGVAFSTQRLFGRDQTLSFSADFSKSDTSYGIYYGNPNLFGGSPKIAFALFSNKANATERFDFDTLSYGIRPSATWDLGEKASLTATLNYSSDTISNLGAGSSALIAADVGQRTRTGLGLRYTHTFAGGRFSLGSEYSTTSTNVQFVKSEAHLDYRWHAPNDAVVLGAGFSAGAIATSAGTSSIGDRFLLGQDAIRGFDFAGYGPRDLNANDAALGGNQYASAQFDAYFPGVLPNQPWFMPGVFLDVGSLWGLDNTAGGPGGGDAVDDAMKLRASLGLSMQFDVGVGALRVFVAEPILQETYDRTQTVQISFNTRF